MKTPKIDQLEDNLLRRQRVSTKDILEVRMEFYREAIKKAVYLLKLRPAFS
jgi:hypothetical protein